MRANRVLFSVSWLGYPDWEGEEDNLYYNTLCAWGKSLRRDGCSYQILDLFDDANLPKEPGLYVAEMDREEALGGSGDCFMRRATPRDLKLAGFVLDGEKLNA